MTTPGVAAAGPPSAAAYGAFLWQLMKTRDALKTLADQAFGAVDLAMPAQSDSVDLNKLAFSLLASAGRTMRNEIAQSVRNNCAGAVLQIAWTLFDAHLEMLGVDRDQRRSVSVGCMFSEGETFSRLLWASRNAFAHGMEWAAVGPRTKAGRISVDILQSAGFEEPSHAGVFDYFMLLSDGDIEIFIQRLQQAAKDASLLHPPAAAESSMKISHLVTALLALGAILLAYWSTEKAALAIDDDVVILFQVGSGEQARTVPVASGPMRSPLTIRSMMEEQAIEALSSDSARPFKEVAARVNAWTAQAEVVMNTDVGSDRFYRDILDLSDRMDEIYRMSTALPNPISLLLQERGCNSLEETHTVIATLLENGGLQAVPFRVVNIDVQAMNKPQTEVEHS